MKSGHNNLLTTLIDTFFPRRCPGCGVYDVWVCESCIIAAADPKIELWNRVSNEHTDQAQSKIQKFISLGVYHQPLLESAMDLYKFHRATELASVFAKLLAPGMNEVILASHIATDSAIVLIPVPLHKRRIRERGFNQNLLLAQKIAEELNQVFGQTAVTCRNDLIIRTRHTKHQTTVDARQRAINLEDAFAVTTQGANILPNATIILVDDIVTTGATLHELAQVILPTQPNKIHATSVLRSH